MRRPDEGDVSFHRLQHFGCEDCEESIEALNRNLCANGLTIRPTGRFLVFRAGDFRKCAARAGYKVNVKATPRVGLAAHCSVYGLPARADDSRRTALMIRRLVKCLEPRLGLSPPAEAC